MLSPKVSCAFHSPCMFDAMACMELVWLDKDYIYRASPCLGTCLLSLAAIERQSRERNYYPGIGAPGRPKSPRIN